MRRRNTHTHTHTAPIRRTRPVPYARIHNVHATTLHSGFVQVPRDLTASLPGDLVNARTHTHRGEVLVQFAGWRSTRERRTDSSLHLFLSLPLFLSLSLSLFLFFSLGTPRAIAQWLILFRPYFYLATSEWSPLDSKKSTMTTDVPNRWQHLEGTRGYLRRRVRERIAFLGSG